MEKQVNSFAVPSLTSEASASSFTLEANHAQDFSDDSEAFDSPDRQNDVKK